MSDPYKNLEQQLRGAVRARRPRRRWGVLPVVVVAGVLGSGAAAAGVVVLQPDDRPENQVKQALHAANVALDTHPACRRVKASAPRLVDDPVPAWLVAKLEVLQRAPDVLPVGKLRMGGPEVLARSVRILRAGDGWSYRFWLSRGVPSFGGAAQRDPVACAEAQRAAALRAAAAFPASVRANVARMVDRQVRGVRDAARGATLIFSLMEVRPDGRPAGGGSGTLHGEKLPATGSVGLTRHGNRRYVALSGLVPDGVASVRVVDRDGSPPQRPRVIEVNDNVFHAELPRRFGPRMTVEWRDAAGRVVRRTHPRY
jgi:hypothetical protein